MVTSKLTDGIDKMLYISGAQIPHMQYKKAMSEFSKGEKVYNKESKMFDICLLLDVVIYVQNQFKNISSYPVYPLCQSNAHD